MMPQQFANPLLTDNDLYVVLADQFRDKRLEIRRTKIHEYNIEAIWERLAQASTRFQH